MADGAGGVYVSAGVGSGITGRGAHIALIDDPIKNREEADSETHRRRVWDWFTNVLYTRLMPVGAVILIMTRWHEDDLGVVKDVAIVPIPEVSWKPENRYH